MEKKTKSKIVRLVIYVLMYAISYCVNRFLYAHEVFEAIMMACAVLFVAGVGVVFLSLIKTQNHRRATILSLLNSLVHYIAAIVILCWALSIFGVNVNTIVTSVGILTLVIGFGAESLISDMVTGVFMLFENQYNVGDIVEVNGFRGTVKSIGIRTTQIMDVGKNIKIINNSDMKNILNRSSNVSIAVSTIDIPYPTDIEKLEEKIPALMEDIYHHHEDEMLSVPKYLGVSELGSSSVTLKFIVEVEEDKIFSVPRVLNHDLLLGFRKLGIECPYPQIDVHNKND